MINISFLNKKSIENHWYYYKWWYIIGSVLAFMLISLIISISKKVEPDYEIAFLTTSDYPDTICQQLSEQLQRFGEDRNGDGEVIVELNAYHVFEDEDAPIAKDPNWIMANNVKFTEDVHELYSFIYITDILSFSQIEQMEPDFFLQNGKWTQASEIGDADEKWISWENWRGLSECAAALENSNEDGSDHYALKDLRWSVRSLPNNNVGGDTQEYFRASVEMLERILCGEWPISQTSETDRREHVHENP